MPRATRSAALAGMLLLGDDVVALIATFLQGADTFVLARVCRALRGVSAEELAARTVKRHCELPLLWPCDSTGRIDLDRTCRLHVRVWRAGWQTRVRMMSAHQVRGRAAAYLHSRHITTQAVTFRHQTSLRGHWHPA